MNEHRVKRARDIMLSSKVECLVVTDPKIRTWLTGFRGSLGWAVLTQDKTALFIDPRYTQQARSEAPRFEIKVCDFGQMLSGTAIAEALPYAAGSPLHLETTGLQYDTYCGMASALKQGQLIPAPGLLRSVRAVKDEAEIRLISKASGIADETVRLLRQNVRPGWTEKRVAWFIERTAQEMGADSMNFILAGSGPRSSLIHAAPTDRKIEDGDILLVDIGPVVSGYGTDLTRSFVVGEPSEWQVQIFEIVKAAQQEAVERVRPGMTGHEADKIARDPIRDAGYGEQFAHLLGHGLGMAAAEPPLLVEAGQDLLEPGSVVTIEPGIYLESKGGIRIEDTVVITETGAKRLTHAPIEL